jgi:Tetratricopeptide repeat.
MATALRLDPRAAKAWFNKASSEYASGRKRQALLSYRKVIELAPIQYPQDIALARQRLVELESQFGAR